MKIIISIITILVLSSVALAMSPYEEAKIKKYGKKKETTKLWKLKQKYIAELPKMNTKGKALLLAREKNIKFCINRAINENEIKKCIPSSMRKN